MGSIGKAISHSTPRPQMVGWNGILTDDMSACPILDPMSDRPPSLRLFAPQSNAEHGMPNVGPTSPRKPKVMYNMQHFTRSLHSGETSQIRPSHNSTRLQHVLPPRISRLQWMSFIYRQLPVGSSGRLSGHRRLYDRARSPQSPHANTRIETLRQNQRRHKSPPVLAMAESLRRPRHVGPVPRPIPQLRPHGRGTVFA